MSTHNIRFRAKVFMLTVICLCTVASLHAQENSTLQDKKKNDQKDTGRVAPFFYGPWNIGAHVGVSYIPYYFHNGSNHLTYSGPGAELGIRGLKKINDQWGAGLQVRLLDFSQTNNTSNYSSNIGGVSYSSVTHSSYRFYQSGLDVMAYWYPNKQFIFNAGPAFTFNLASKGRSYGTAMQTIGGNTTTTNIGDKTFRKLDGTKSNLQYGFNIGGAYVLNTNGHAIQPFLNARIPLNSTLDVSDKNNMYDVTGGVNIDIATTDGGAVSHHDNYTREKKECKASKNTKELKVSIPLDNITKTVEEVANKIPRVEAKISIKPMVTVKQGEECCSIDKPPVSYTEIKGGWEGSFEININLWGIPDINYSLKLWPCLLIAEFKCKLYAGPTGKISAERVGKSYGSLLGNEEPRPDCKSCVYFNLKAEGYLRIGVKAGGAVKLYHWTPSIPGFDVTGDADEEIEVSADANASIGNGFNGTYTEDKDCVKPPLGLHGVFFLGKAKANLKFTIKLGPISFDPSYEISLCDGTEIPF